MSVEANTIKNFLTIDFKSMLTNHLACQGIAPPKLVNCPPAGRLIYFQQNWSKVTQDQWVLSTIQGYLIDFSLIPHQPVIPHCPQYSAEQSRLISEEATELLQKRAIGEGVTVEQTGFYSACPKEGWRAMPSNKSQNPQQLCEQRTFQNGGHSHSERSEKGRLAGQNRFERCLLFNTHPPQPQKISQVHVPRDLPIQLPTLRPILSPMSVHKNSKTSTSNPLRERSTANLLYKDEKPSVCPSVTSVSRRFCMD